jgi:predicted transcriptional regulator of viral defense system
VLKIAFWRNIMKFIDFKEKLKCFPVFSLSEIKKIDSKFHRRRLNEWQEKGYIKKLIRGYYIFADLEINENILFEIANRIYAPSYISFEIALSYYSLIPESIYQITSASTRKTNCFSTPIIEFSYNTIKPTLFFGYNLVSYNNRAFKIACPEKALLDYFYMNTQIKSNVDFESLRINSASFFEKCDRKKFLFLANKFLQKRLINTVNLFLEFIEHA